MNQDQLALLEGLNDIQELSAQDLFDVAGGYSTTPITYPYWQPNPYVPGGGSWVYQPPTNPYGVRR